jgi:very-short-patch-repair endonuclease
MDKYDVSIYFYPELINIYKFFNITSLYELVQLLIKETNIKISCEINHKEIINLINNNYSHPLFLTLKWVQQNKEPTNITKKHLSQMLYNYYKKEEIYIISKIYLYFYNKINLKYQFKVQFTSYIIDLLIGNNICIEIDENSHTNYNKDNEIDRNKLLSLIGYKVIHINPTIFYMNEQKILKFIECIYIDHIKNNISYNLKVFDHLNYINDKKIQNTIKFKQYKNNSDHIWLY